MLAKISKSVGYALNGFKTVWNEELNFRIEIVIALIVLVIAFIYKFSLNQFLFCFVAILFVVSAEIINTVVEDLCNKIQPENDPAIKKIKDMMSSFVLVYVLGAAVIGFFIFGNIFF